MMHEHTLLLKVQTLTREERTFKRQEQAVKIFHRVQSGSGKRDHMASSYIPTKDADFQNWILNWSTLLTAAPATYGVTAADATAQAAQYALWYAAYGVAVNPATKTKTTVAAKNAARVAATDAIRPLAQTISVNDGVTNANKLALGLNLKGSTGPTPIPTPTSNPVLQFIAATQGEQTFKWVDSSDGVSRKKPFGVLALVIFAQESSTPITDPTLLAFQTLETKQPFGLDTSFATPGARVYTASYYITRTGLKGPWSPVVNNIAM
jgi:hypothetical protein